MEDGKGAGLSHCRLKLIGNAGFGNDPALAIKSMDIVNGRGFRCACIRSEAQIDGDARHALCQNAGDHAAGIPMGMACKDAGHLAMPNERLGKAPHPIPIIELKPVFRFGDFKWRMMHEQGRRLICVFGQRLGETVRPDIAKITHVADFA